MKNSKNIFSLGDCSTVQFKKFSEYVLTLLERFEIVEDVEISAEQFRGKTTFLAPTLNFKSFVPILG